MEVSAAPRRATSPSAAERRPPDAAPDRAAPVMQWRRAGKRYPGAGAPALDDVSFAVRPGRTRPGAAAWTVARLRVVWERRRRR